MRLLRELPISRARLREGPPRVLELSPNRYRASLSRAPLRFDRLPSAHDQTIRVEEDRRFPQNRGKRGELGGRLHLESMVAAGLQLYARKRPMAGGCPTDHVALDRLSSHASSVRCEPPSVSVPPKRSAALLYGPSSKSPCEGRKDRGTGNRESPLPSRRVCARRSKARRRRH